MMTIGRAREIGDMALDAHDADAVLVAADAFEEAGQPRVAEYLRWRAVEIRNGSTKHPVSW